MKSKFTYFKQSLFLIFILITLTSKSQDIVAYDFTFTSVWNSSDHGTLPNSPHWSDLVGTTHNSSIQFWQLGQIATIGVKDVAEKGNNSNFEIEINNAISNGEATAYLETSVLPSAAISSATFTDIEVSKTKPLLTLISMIAPSPDWFIGVNSFSLLDNQGNWKANGSPLIIDLFPIDAGTDAGMSYEANDSSITPPIPITNIDTKYGFNGQKIGTLSITFKGVVLGLEDDLAKKSETKIFPNPTSNLLTINNLSNHKAIALYDITGKRIFNKTINRISDYSFNTNQYNKGLYFIKLTDIKNNTNIRKVLIQ